MKTEQYDNHVIKPELSIFDTENNEYRLLSKETEEKMDAQIEAIYSYMESNVGFGKEDEEKDRLYKEVQDLWEDYAQTLRDADLMLQLTRKQHAYLTTLLNDKMEYDVKTIFEALSLHSRINEWVDAASYKNDEEMQHFPLNATEVILLYHMIAPHKVKGLKKEAYTFSEILKRFGAITKVITYYDNLAKAANRDVTEWVANFEPQELPEQTEA